MYVLYRLSYLALLMCQGGTRTHDPVLPKQEVTDSTASQKYIVSDLYIEAENKKKSILFPSHRLAVYCEVTLPAASANYFSKIVEKFCSSISTLAPAIDAVGFEPTKFSFDSKNY